MTPAGLVVWYYQTRESLGAPGLNFIDSTGRVYAKDCEACDYKFRNCNKVGAWVCGRCGKPWAFEDHFILKGEVQTPNPTDIFERQLSKWVDVGVVLYNILKDPEFFWDMRLYVATCNGFKVDPRRDPVEGDEARPPLADMFVLLWPNAPGPWGRRSMFYRVSRAKKEWTRQLSKTGIKYS